ncbi:hypothetical protein HPP92_026828, partial [Vanilla planifolia]
GMFGSFRNLWHARLNKLEIQKLAPSLVYKREEQEYHHSRDQTIPKKDKKKESDNLMNRSLNKAMDNGGVPDTARSNGDCDGAVVVFNPRENVAKLPFEKSKVWGYVFITIPNGILDHEEALMQNVGGQVLGFFHKKWFFLCVLMAIRKL